MRILVIGSGGREHALCWKLKQSACQPEMYCAPGNPGIAEIAELVPLAVDDLSGLTGYARSEKIDLTVVGPEYPLSLGVVDKFTAAGLRIFGPTQAAARLEASKFYAKQVMQAAGVRTAEWVVAGNIEEARRHIRAMGLPIVLKADGLAAGKGVFVCANEGEAENGLGELYARDREANLVIERCLQGQEVSFIVATDGQQIIPMASSHDHKRIFDGQRGPNTGGMGAVSPSPRLSVSQEQEVIESVVRPVLNEMNRRGHPFRGFLYAGLMIDETGQISVLEFNVRFGDPECQPVMVRYEGDLAELLLALSDGCQISEHLRPRWRDETAVCVVIAAEGYPGTVKTGDEITGVAAAQDSQNVIVFHAGSARRSDGRLVTAGGRVLGVTAWGMSLTQARERAYGTVESIEFRGRQYRRDIGLE